MTKNSGSDSGFLFPRVGTVAASFILVAGSHMAAAADTLVGDVGRRTPELDRRVATHEASHAFVARFSGMPLGGCTIEPAEDGSYSGLCWGPGAEKSRYTTEAIDLCQQITPLMPGPGEHANDAAEIFLHARNRCLELAAGSAGEEVLLPGPPLVARDDQKQAEAYAAIVCRTAGAVDSFISFAREEARGLIRTYSAVVKAIADALVEHRTLDGEQIDRIVSATLAQDELAAEKLRRAEWARTVANAQNFEASRELQIGDVPADAERRPIKPKE